MTKAPNGDLTRLAKAMLRAELSRGVVEGSCDFDAAWRHEAEVWTSYARALLTELREPSEGMIDATVYDFPNVSPEGAQFQRDAAAETLREMIDHILESS